MGGGHGCGVVGLTRCVDVGNNTLLLLLLLLLPVVHQQV